MQVSITGRHVEITAALKSYVLAKLDHLEELFPKVKKAQVVLIVEKYRHSAEIHYHADFNEYHAKKTTKDMYASIDGAVKALEHQAHKRKDKLRSQKSKRVSAAKVKGRNAARSEAPGEERLSVETARVSRLPKIVRVKSVASKPMREEDAALALSESGRDFLVYEDARSGRHQVLFKREDGAFGLIEV
jgi:putative sigma-54 modulation protein